MSALAHLRARRALPVFALLVAALVTSACASSGGPAARRRSSVVTYLAATPAEGGATATRRPTLRLPLRVGIAFVPDGGDGMLRKDDEVFTARDRIVLMEQVRTHFAARPWVDRSRSCPTSTCRLTAASRTSTSCAA
jgi:rhombotail lipoprotein